MKVTLKQIDGLAMAAKADSNHWVTMDGPERLGGHEAATSPVQLVLMGLAGCTGMDVVNILKKRRITLTDFTIEVEAQQADEYPKVFTEIHLRYRLKGENLHEADVEKAIELSENKYCSVLAMLKSTAKVSHEYEILAAEMTE